MTDAELRQRQEALVAKQLAMKEQMMREGTHLFCGKRYYNSTHGSVVLHPYMKRNQGAA